MAENDPERLADQLDEEVEDMKRRSDELKQRTSDVSQEWESKRSDPSVPGAQPPKDDEDQDDGDRAEP